MSQAILNCTPIGHDLQSRTHKSCLGLKYNSTPEPLTQPDYTHLVLTAAQTRSLASAKSVHAAIVKSGLEHKLTLYNHMLNMYSKCEATCETRRIFDEIPQPNSVSFNILLSHYARMGLPQIAFSLFINMCIAGSQPDSFTLSTLLRVATDVDDFRLGASLHAFAIKCDHAQDVSVATALITTYFEYGSEDSAYLFFEKFAEVNLAIFNSMIGGCVKNGSLFESLKLFVQMREAGVWPDDITFLSSLKAASANGFLGFGSQLHGLIIKMGFESVVPISSALISMYSDHGELDLALKLFNQRQPSNNLFLWTAIITGLIENSKNSMAINLFQRMLVQGIEPDSVVYQCLLQACTNLFLIYQGKELHARLIRTIPDSKTSMGKLLISLYSKCGRPDDGFKVFDQMAETNAHTWSQLILLCKQECSYEKALEIFITLMNDGVKVEELTFITVIQICGEYFDVRLGKQLHCSVFKLGFHSNLHIASALVQFYSKNGMIETANSTFCQIAEPDTVLWTALISAYNENGDAETTFKLFCQMINHGTTPDAYTLASVISSCSSRLELHRGRAIQAYAIKRMLNSDLQVGNALILLYSECSLIHIASKIFSQMPERDAASFGTMIAAFTKYEKPEMSRELFTQMLVDEVEPDGLVISAMISSCSFLASLESGRKFHALAIKHNYAASIPVCNSLTTMYSRCAHIDEACSIFQEMDARNSVSWNTMILGLAQNGRSAKAIGLFKEMQESAILPNSSTFIAVLTACSHEGMVHEGQQYFEMMCRDYDLEPTEDHYSCMIDLFSRAGALDQAMNFIRRMPSSPSAAAWTALLLGCRKYGEIEIGKVAAEHLISTKPDDAAAYILLANMYAEAGLWENANEVRRRLKSQKVKKEPGWSWIEIDDEVHVFTVHDFSHRHNESILKALEQLHEHIKILWY